MGSTLLETQVIILGPFHTEARPGSTWQKLGVLEICFLIVEQVVILRVCASLLCPLYAFSVALKFRTMMLYSEPYHPCVAGVILSVWLPLLSVSLSSPWEIF